MVGVGDVTDGPDPGSRGAQPGVHHDSVVHVQTGLFGELDVRLRAHRDEDQVGVDELPVVQADAGGPSAVADDLGDAHAHPQGRRRARVCRSANTCATSGPSTATSGSSAFSRIVTATSASRAAAAISSPIQPAPMITRCRVRCSCSAITSESSMVRSMSTPARSDPGSGSRRGRAPVASRMASAPTSRAVGERHPARIRVECGGRGPELHVHRVLRVPGRRMDEHAVALRLALQVVLGQRRSLVRQVRLRADDGDPAGEPLAPAASSPRDQRRSRLRPRARNPANSRPVPPGRLVPRSRIGPVGNPMGRA